MNKEGDMVQKVNLKAPPAPPQRNDNQSILQESMTISKKNYSWAIKKDVVIVIMFVIWCTFTYKALIHGMYWGVAVHPISEFQNDSMSYWSSSSSEEDESQFSPDEEELEYEQDMNALGDEAVLDDMKTFTNDYH